MKIQIKEPCNEDWSKMKIGLISRHCDVCDKSVFDFTQKSREEIIIHLLSNPNESVCGRMTGQQFDFRHEDIPILIEVLKGRPTNNSFLVLTLACLTLAACNTSNSSHDKKSTENEKVVRTLGEVMLPEVKDSIVKDEINQVKIPNIVLPEVIEDGIGEYITYGGAIAYEPEPPPLPPQVKGELMIQPYSIDSTSSCRVLKFAEKMPEYDGGMEAMFSFINRQIKYPKYEKKNKIEGTVYAKIIVNSDGTISNPTIIKSVEGSQNFDHEVLRVISKMPNWIAGENNGKKVTVEYTLPFQFVLK